MSIYSKNQSLNQNLTRLIDFDTSTNIYNVIKLFLLQHNEIILEKLPDFYRIFLKEPTKFKEFLDTIYQDSLTCNTHIYKDINILTCMCCAVFHLTKLYIMLNRIYTEYDHVLQDAAHYFHIPLGTWIYNIITNCTFEDKTSFLIQHSKYKFANTFQYLLLMCYVSKELKLSDRPLFKYLEAIHKVYHDPSAFNQEYPKLFEPIDDILKVLVADEYIYNKDIYNFHFKLQYSLNNNRIDIMHNEIIHYEYFVEKYTELNFDNIFINNTYNITKYTKSRLNLKSTFYHYYMNDLSCHKLPIFIIFELIFDLAETYSVISTQMYYHEVEIDNKWLYFCNKLYQFLMHSENLETDFTFVIYSLGGHINYNHWFTSHDDVFKRDETLLFAVVKNLHFEKNAQFIQKLLKGILSKDFSKFPKYMMKN